MTSRGLEQDDFGKGPALIPVGGGHHEPHTGNGGGLPYAIGGARMLLRAGLLLLLALARLIGADNTCKCLQRSDGIVAAKKEIGVELLHSGNNWNAWFDQLKPFRKELAWKIEAANHVTRAGRPLLRADGWPPMFMEAYLADFLLANNQSLDQFVKSRPSIPIVIGFDRWLKSKGIDLILAPVPRVLEIYPERFIGKTPPDRIIAPHMRKLLLELLDSDIEVLDLLPAFLPAAKDGPQLYLSSDPHWSSRAQEITAALIAERLRRYPFVRKALASKSAFTVKTIDVDFGGADFPALANPERAAIENTNHLKLPQVSYLDGRLFEEPEKSPVVVIGDSFTNYFRGSIAKATGIDALLSRAINLATANIASGGATTEPIKDILRNPQQLSVIKVVVWIIAEDNLTDVLRSNGPVWTPIRFP